MTTNLVSPPQAERLPPAAKRCRVIVCDDHDVVRAGLRALIQEESRIEVVGEAANAAQTSDLCSWAQPDVVLLDLRLPDASGVDICRDLKLAHPEIKVLFLTSYGDEANIMAALTAGADGYLLKTITGDNISAAILQVAAGGAVLDPLVTRRLIGHLKTSTPQETLLRQLSPRERCVLQGVLKGQINKEIAAHCGVSEKTIRNQLTAIYEKLGVKARAEAILLFGPGPLEA